jgi:hypothetical protein
MTRSEREKDLTNRFTFHPPKDAPTQRSFETQLQRYEKIRSKMLDVALYLNAVCPEGRELSSAFTHLEEAVFWANAAIARNE